MVTKKELKPELVDLYLKTFVDQIQKLNSEIENNTILNKYTSKVTILFIIIDSVARPIIQNRVQY